MKCNIISSDSNLAGNFNSLFPQIMHIFDCINEWNNEINAWLQLSVESFESMQ